MDLMNESIRERPSELILNSYPYFKLLMYSNGVTGQSAATSHVAQPDSHQGETRGAGYYES